MISLNVSPRSLWLHKWGGSKESTSQCERCTSCRFDPWVRKIRWSRKRQPTPVFLHGKFHGQMKLAGYSTWGQRVGLDWATEHTQITHGLVVKGKVKFSGWSPCVWILSKLLAGSCGTEQINYFMPGFLHMWNLSEISQEWNFSWSCYIKSIK